MTRVGSKKKATRSTRCILLILFSACTPLLIGESKFEPVLQINDLKVSAYCLSKYFRRQFPNGLLPKEPNAQGEHEQWLLFFLSKQLVISSLKDRGYFGRPEVLNETEKMSRYMLCSPEGPYYIYLYSQKRPPIEAPDVLRERVRKVFDIVAVRFPDSTSAKELLGDSFRQLRFPDQVRALQSCKGSSAFIFDGRMVWPFQDISEFSEELYHLKPGGILTDCEKSTGVLYAAVRSVDTMSAAELSGFTGQLKERLEMSFRAQVQRVHRADVLNGSRPTVNREVFNKLTSLIDGSPQREGRLPESKSIGANGEVLFTYEGPVGRRSISVGEFIAEYNGRYVRKGGRGETVLNDAIVDDIVSDRDIAEARRLGLDQEAEFLEDRENFLRFQALDLYERTELQPKIRLDEETLRKLYSSKRNSFSQPCAVIIKVARAKTLEEARDFAQYARDERQGPQSAFREIELRSGDSLMRGAYFWSMLFSSAPGCVMGPIPDGNAYVVAKRDRTSQVKFATFEEVRNYLCGFQLRIEEDRLELGMAKAESRTCRIVDRINYADFGVRKEVSSPWN